MLENIKRVEAARAERIEQAKKGEAFPLLSQDDGAQLLRKFHPDHKDGTKRKLKIGKNKGDFVPNELADLLEANPRIELEKVDLEKIDYDTDVLVIGGGVSGMSSALGAADDGYNVLLVEKQDALGGWAAKMHKQLPQSYPFEAIEENSVQATIDKVTSNSNVSTSIK